MLKKNKLFAWALCLCLTASVAVTMTACGDDDTDGNKETTPTTTAADTVAETDPATTPETPAATDPAETDPAESDPADTDPAETADPCADGHDYTITVVDPTCTEDGYTFYVCKVCDHTEKDDIEPASHKYDNGVVTDPTCTTGGYTTFTCTVEGCGYSYQTAKTDPAHKYDAGVVTAPTCTVDGYTTYTCTVEGCGNSYTADPVAASHAYDDGTVVPPTCTEDGYTLFSCTRTDCTVSYREDPVPATHVYTGAPINRVLPTATTAGYTEFKCDNCEHTEQLCKIPTIGEIFTGTTVAADATPVALGVIVAETTDADAFVTMKAAGIDYVILMVGMREDKETSFEANYEAAKAAGLDVGVYYVSEGADATVTAADAARVVGWLEGKTFEYPIYYAAMATELTEAPVNAFMDALWAEGYYPALMAFSAPTFTVKYDICFCKSVAAYATYAINATVENPTWDTTLGETPYSSWNFTDTATIEGLDGLTISALVSYKDYPSVIKRNNLNGFEPTAYAWIVVANSLNVRSSPDFTASDNKVGIVRPGEKYILLEKTSSYTKILFPLTVQSEDPDGEPTVELKECYISARLIYVQFSEPAPAAPEA